MVQAAAAIPPDFWVLPQSITFMFDTNETITKSAEINLRGTLDLAWTVEESLAWLDVAPVSHSIFNRPIISVDPAELVGGWQEGQLTIFAESIDGKNYSESIAVRAFLGEVQDHYLPAIKH